MLGATTTPGNVVKPYAPKAVLACLCLIALGVPFHSWMLGDHAAARWWGFRGSLEIGSALYGPAADRMDVFLSGIHPGLSCIPLTHPAMYACLAGVWITWSAAAWGLLVLLETAFIRLRRSFASARRAGEGGSQT